MFHPIKDFLQGALRRTGSKTSITATVIVEAAGPLLLNLLPNLRPADFRVISYKDGRLTVAVANPLVGQEIRLRLDAILEVLGETFLPHSFEQLRLIPLIDEEAKF